jgi:TaqI-like C-terminal specificity domain
MGIENGSSLDSWEIFLGLVVDSLKERGRFAILVPETFFSPEKARTRRWLLEKITLEKVYALGADWFTADVRMGTVVIQGVKAQPSPDHRFHSLLIAGRERQEAQAGTRPIEQLEFASRHETVQARCLQNSDAQIQVLASDSELDLLARIDAHSVPISAVTSHARGDEINADGLIWTCGSCNGHTVPGERKRGGRYESKNCPSCGALLSQDNVTVQSIIRETADTNFRVVYIDGTELTRRYQRPHTRFMRTDLTISPPLKSPEIFTGPKILIRQAGVGITATLVDDSCRCPQSVYIYRATPEALAAGYANEFILGCLVSRTMNYICMKKYAEIDPAKAFAKLTHARIAPFPIPKLTTEDDRRHAHDVGLLVREMLQGAPNSGGVDHRIELTLRQLWKISGDEGRFINGFFSTLPDGQAVRDLFPDGAPSRIQFPVSQNLDFDLSA